MMQASSSHIWRSLSLGDGILAAAICEQIKGDFAQLYAGCGDPAATAVFARRDEGDLHCQVTVFFSPACARLAQQLGAVPDAAPARAGLELLAGVPACWAALFPIA